jgi:hypothetical protein
VKSAGDVIWQHKRHAKQLVDILNGLRNEHASEVAALKREISTLRDENAALRGLMHGSSAKVRGRDGSEFFIDTHELPRESLEAAACACADEHPSCIFTAPETFTITYNGIDLTPAVQSLAAKPETFICGRCQLVTEGDPAEWIRYSTLDPEVPLCGPCAEESAQDKDS